MNSSQDNLSHAAVAEVEPCGAECNKRARQMKAAVQTAAARTADRIGGGGLLAAALVFGLVTGLAEGVYWFVCQYGLGQLTFLHRAVHWMAPLTYAVIFGAAAGVAAGILWMAGRTVPRGLVTTLLATLSAYCLLLLAPGLHLVARILLACGIGAAVGRCCEKYRLPSDRALGRTLGWLSLGVIALAAVERGSLGISRRQALAALPPQDTTRPNVILLVLDTLRADAIGCYGGPSARTVNLDRLADEGVLFEQATSTAPWTLPATTSLITGRLPRETGTDWFVPLGEEFPTLAERLRDAGYLTAGFVANTRYCSAEVGLARGCTYFEDHTFALEEFLLCTAAGREFLSSFLSVRLGCCDMPARKSAAAVNAGLLRWLDRQDNRPFFAFINYLDAHDPYLAASPRDDGSSDREVDYEDLLTLRFWWWKHKGDLDTGKTEWIQERYARCVESLDRQIGNLIDQLRLRGKLDNTLIVITADHGEHLGEHGLYLHGNSLYQPLVHVPLLVVWPGRVPAGRRVPEPVSIADVPATILELAAGDSVQKLPGATLAPLWSDSLEKNGGQRISRSIIVTEVLTPPAVPPCQGRSPIFGGSSRAVRVGDYKYIRHGDGREELYDLRSDPGEIRNLALLETVTAGAAPGSRPRDAATQETLDQLRSIWKNAG